MRLKEEIKVESGQWMVKPIVMKKKGMSLTTGVVCNK